MEYSEIRSDKVFSNKVVVDDDTGIILYKLYRGMLISIGTVERKNSKVIYYIELFELKNNDFIDVEYSVSTLFSEDVKIDKLGRIYLRSNQAYFKIGKIGSTIIIELPYTCKFREMV